jgi:LacI family transcriptional regulator
MKNRISIRDIAKECSVSIGTVSRALSDDKKINIITRNKIKKVAEELGYVPNALARNLSKKTSNIVGILIPDITNPFFAEVAKTIENYAREKGFSIFLCNTNLSIENEKVYIEKLYSYLVDGIIILPVSLEINHILKRFSLLNNIVFLAYMPQSIKEANYVISDDHKIVYLALNYLINIGHKKISYLGGEENLFSNMLRRNSFFNIMNQFNLKPIILNSNRDNYFNQANIVEEIKYDLITASELPSAILTYNDNLALNTIQAIEEIGLKVPDDISVIGIDDISIAKLYNVQLTTVAQDKSEIGKKCAEIIINKITGKSKVFEHFILEPKLIVRKSTRSLK